MSSTPASAFGWLPTIADRMAAEPREAADDVLGEALLHLEELAVVDHAPDHVVHVVGLVRAVRDQRVELGVLAVGRVGRRREDRRIDVVLRQEREQVARVLEARLLVGRDEVRDSRLRRVRRRRRRAPRTMTSSPVTVFTTSGPVMNMYDEPSTMKHEVGHRRRVDRAARARADHERELRDHAGGLDVAPEDLRVAGERDDALLDARAARVVDPDHRAAVAARPCPSPCRSSRRRPPRGCRRTR